MARNQKNFKNFTYVDDSGRAWNKRGEDGGAATAVDGHAAAVGSQPNWGPSSRRHSPRKIVYQDPVTFRTIDPIFYTSAAYSAVAIGDVLAVTVAGLATTVNYSAVQKVPERQPGNRASRELPDS